VTPRRALLGIVLACLATAPSVARTHRVRSGETLHEIAKEEFGDPGLADLLGLHNGLAPGTRLRADARLDLPEGRVLRVVRAQTFADLSERTLGSRVYAPLLAALNRRDVKESLGFGMHIVIPALLDHRLAPDEDLASIAALFYGDPGRTWALELANPNPAKAVKVPVVGFFRESLGAGETDLVKAARKQMIRESQTAVAAKPSGEPPPAATPEAGGVAAGAPPGAGPSPVTSGGPPAGGARSPAVVPSSRPVSAPPSGSARPAATPAPPPAEPIEERASGGSPRPGSDGPEGAAAEPSRPTGPPASVAVDVPRPAIPERILWPPLEEARRAVQDGDYHRAEIDLTALLDSGRIPRDLRPQAWLLLGLSRVARGESGPARAAFAQVRKLNPSLDLDPFYYSPKVRAAFTTAAKP
jgi:hypothetical protein